MTIALIAVAVAAVILAVALAVIARRASVARRQAGQRADELARRSSELTTQIDQAEQDKRGAEVKATAAENRLRAAEQKTTEAERRSGEAEKRVAEAMRRADEAVKAAEAAEQRAEEADRRAAEAERRAEEAERRAEEAERRAEEAEPGTARSGGHEGPAIWDLERLRIEREWLDVVGPGVPLPQPWDGTVNTVVATELSVIRETIGTPSELDLHPPSAPLSPARAAVAARVSVELLRTLARSGEEMDVTISPDELQVVQSIAPGETAPDLSALAAVAATADLELSLEVREGRSTARLRLS
jgi:hypothetical protein